jgi:hypothetical protein
MSSMARRFSGSAVAVRLAMRSTSDPSSTSITFIPCARMRALRLRDVHDVAALVTSLTPRLYRVRKCPCQQTDEP